MRTYNFNSMEKEESGSCLEKDEKKWPSKIWHHRCPFGCTDCSLPYFFGKNIVPYTLCRLILHAKWLMNAFHILLAWEIGKTFSHQHARWLVGKLFVLQPARVKCNQALIFPENKKNGASKECFQMLVIERRKSDVDLLQIALGFLGLAAKPFFCPLHKSPKQHS